MNVDASINMQSRVSTAGGVLRDENGSWVAGFTYMVGITTILGAEIWGIYQGLLLRWNRGFRRVEIETDSLVASRKVTEKVYQFDTNGQLIRDIQELVQRNWNCKITHIFREANACMKIPMVWQSSEPPMVFMSMKIPLNVLHLFYWLTPQEFQGLDFCSSLSFIPYIYI
ncbi:hypothetical protein REPUB_Repub18cG0142900 [Reevesia pubescens]